MYTRLDQQVYPMAFHIRDAATDAAALVERFLNETNATVSVIDRQTAALAVKALARFGKGYHPAGLNMGDCFAYACARQRGEPLLCKGNDFPHTDIALG